jgi:hypothetical protein
VDIFNRTRKDLMVLVDQCAEIRAHVGRLVPDDVVKTDAFAVGFCMAMSWIFESPMMPDPVTDSDFLIKFYAMMTTILDNAKMEKTENGIPEPLSNTKH